MYVYVRSFYLFIYLHTHLLIYGPCYISSRVQALHAYIIHIYTCAVCIGHPRGASALKQMGSFVISGLGL